MSSPQDLLTLGTAVGGGAGDMRLQVEMGGEGGDLSVCVQRE